MEYFFRYNTPEGFSDILLISDGYVLTGLYFDGSSIKGKSLMIGNGLEDMDINRPLFSETINWLDIYFHGGIPDFTPEYRIEAVTAFRQEVYEELLRIPYGHTVTYGYIAGRIAEKRGCKKMSAQAVGGAVGSNPICLILPCHRVIGKDGSMTGYGGGIDNKIALLKLESTGGM